MRDLSTCHLSLLKVQFHHSFRFCAIFLAAAYSPLVHKLMQIFAWILFADGVLHSEEKWEKSRYFSLMYGQRQNSLIPQFETFCFILSRLCWQWMKFGNSGRGFPALIFSRSVMNSLETLSDVLTPSIPAQSLSTTFFWIYGHPTWCSPMFCFC